MINRNLSLEELTELLPKIEWSYVRDLSDLGMNFFSSRLGRTYLTLKRSFFGSVVFLATTPNETTSYPNVLIEYKTRDKKIVAFYENLLKKLSYKNSRVYINELKSLRELLK